MGICLLARTPRIRGEFVQQWKPCVMAQEAVSIEAAKTKLRGVLAYNNCFKSMDVQIGDAALFYKSANRGERATLAGPSEDSGK